MIAWRDAFAAFVRMPVLFGVATLLTFVQVVVTEPFLSIKPMVEADLLSFFVVLFASGMVSSLLLTPVAIAVHRYVLLGEVTGRYQLSPTNPRFRRFFLFALVFECLWGVPVSLFGLIYGFQGFALFVSFLVVLLTLIVVMIVSLRTLILFPAIAVDAPGTDWRNALSDTKGHSWRVFFLVTCVAIPAAVVSWTLEWCVGRWTGQSGAGTAVLGLVQSINSVALIAAYAAAASRLYWAFAERLGRSPEAAISPA